MNLKYKVKHLLNTRDQRFSYFHNNRNSIAKTNLQLISSVSVMTFVIICFFNFVTPFFFENWKLTIEYILMPLFTVPFYIFSIVYLKRNKAPKRYNYHLCNFICALFLSALLIYLIYLSTVHPFFKDLTQVYISLTFMFMPVIFIIPQIEVSMLMVVFGTIFVLLSHHFKTTALFRSDFFSITAAFIFSQGTGYYVWLIRLREYDLQKKLRALCRLDRLTGIFNKATFENECRKYCSTRKESEPCSLFIIDIDNFKIINDTFGHVVGDELLDGFGHALKYIIRSNDIVGRIGGDEFCILLRNTSDEDLLQRKALEIQKKISLIFPKGNFVKITCSIGISTCASGRIMYIDLLKKADESLYRVKSCGKNSFLIQKTLQN